MLYTGKCSVGAIGVKGIRRGIAECRLHGFAVGRVLASTFGIAFYLLGLACAVGHAGSFCCGVSGALRLDRLATR